MAGEYLTDSRSTLSPEVLRTLLSSPKFDQVIIDLLVGRREAAGAIMNFLDDGELLPREDRQTLALILKQDPNAGTIQRYIDRIRERLSANTSDEIPPTEKRPHASAQVPTLISAESVSPDENPDERFSLFAKLASGYNNERFQAVVTNLLLQKPHRCAGKVWELAQARPTEVKLKIAAKMLALPWVKVYEKDRIWDDIKGEIRKDNAGELPTVILNTAKQNGSDISEKVQLEFLAMGFCIGPDYFISSLQANSEKTQRAIVKSFLGGPCGDLLHPLGNALKIPNLSPGLKELVQNRIKRCIDTREKRAAQYISIEQIVELALACGAWVVLEEEPHAFSFDHFYKTITHQSCQLSSRSILIESFIKRFEEISQKMHTLNADIFHQLLAILGECTPSQKDTLAQKIIEKLFSQRALDRYSIIKDPEEVGSAVNAKPGPRAQAIDFLSSMLNLAIDPSVRKIIGEKLLLFKPCHAILDKIAWTPELASDAQKSKDGLDEAVKRILGE
jgi:hypothetical protein